MADVILFSSDVNTNKRLALIADDVGGPNVVAPLRIEIRNAADALFVSHVVTPTNRIRLLQLWQPGAGGRGADRSTQLKDSPTPQLWCSMDKNNVSTWSGALAADVDSLSEEIVLTRDQTSTLIGWLDFGYQV